MKRTQLSLLSPSLRGDNVSRLDEGRASADITWSDHRQSRGEEPWPLPCLCHSPPSQSLCPDHQGQPLRFFCLACVQPACGKCVDESHADHTCVRMEEDTCTKRAEIEGLRAQVKKAISDVMVYVVRLSSVLLAAKEVKIADGDAKGELGPDCDVTSALVERDDGDNGGSAWSRSDVKKLKRHWKRMDAEVEKAFYSLELCDAILREGQGTEADHVVPVLTERLRALNQAKQAAVSLDLPFSADAGPYVESPSWTCLRQHLSAAAADPPEMFTQLSRIGSHPQHRGQSQAPTPAFRCRSLSPSHRFQVFKSPESLVHSSQGELSLPAADARVASQPAHQDLPSYCYEKNMNRFQDSSKVENGLGGVELEKHSENVASGDYVSEWVGENFQASPKIYCTNKNCLLLSESMGDETPQSGTGEENEILQSVQAENFSDNAEVIILEEIDLGSEEKTQLDEERVDIEIEIIDVASQDPQNTEYSCIQTKAVPERNETSNHVPLDNDVTTATDGSATDTSARHASPKEKQTFPSATVEKVIPKQLQNTKVTKRKSQIGMASPSRPLTTWTQVRSELALAGNTEMSRLPPDTKTPVTVEENEKDLTVSQGRPDDHSRVSGSEIRYKAPVQRACKETGMCSLQLRRSFHVRCLGDAVLPLVVGLAYSKQAGIVVLDGANDKVKVFSRRGQLRHLLAPEEAARCTMFERAIAIMGQILLNFISSRRLKNAEMSAELETPSGERNLKNEEAFTTIGRQISPTFKVGSIRAKTPSCTERCSGIPISDQTCSFQDCPLDCDPKDDSRSSEDEEVAGRTDKTSAVTTFNKCCSGECEAASTQQKPSFFCVQRNGNVIIVDRETSLLTVVDPLGKTLLKTSTLTFGLQSPIHVVNDGGSTLLMSDKEAFLYVLKITSRSGQGHCRRRKLPLDL